MGLKAAAPPVPSAAAVAAARAAVSGSGGATLNLTHYSLGGSGSMVLARMLLVLSST